MKKHIVQRLLIISSIVIIVMSSITYCIVSFSQDHFYRDDKRELTFKFPSDVRTGKSYAGEIIYRSNFDSITKKFNTEPDVYPQRYVLYRYKIISENEYYTNRLTEPTKDTVFSEVDCRHIKLADIQFINPGIYYIDGMLEDSAFTLQINGTDTIINPHRSKIRVTAKVIVN